MGAQEQEGTCTLAWRKFSYYWSMVLLVFAITVVLYGIGMGWNNPPWSQKHSHPAFEMILFIVLLYWISCLEGCQISIVGLQDIDMTPYKHSHPRAYRVGQLLHKGPGVERFLVGRQFLLLFNGFLVSRLGGASGAHADFKIGEWEWGDEASQFFWANSILLLIVIIVPGQLTSQLMAADKMMEYLNLPFVQAEWTVAWPCLIIESLGLTHSSYILKDLLVWMTNMDTSEQDQSKLMKKNWVYYTKCVISITAVIFAGIFLFKGWAMSQTNATEGSGWRHLPGGAAVVVSLLFLFTMACAEGLQVSGLALMKKNTSDFKESSPKAYATCELMFKGRNMQAFLVGRQFMVALMMVLLGRVTGYAGAGGVLVNDKNMKYPKTSGGGSGEGYYTDAEFAALEELGTNTANWTRVDVASAGDDWGMGAGFNEWALQAGFLGAVFVVNVAQLASQVAASIFPIGFINNTFLNVLLRIMLLIEASGIVSACWPLAWFFDRQFKLRKDPFDAETPDQAIIARQKSMGMMVETDEQGNAVGPFASAMQNSQNADAYANLPVNPDQSYNVEYSYKVSFI
jgi:hypothetical protein